MKSKFKNLHPENKEEILQLSLLTIFILCLVFLKPLVRLLLAYAEFCEKLFN